MLRVTGKTVDDVERQSHSRLPEQQPSRHTRTRTGCQRCRVRRRKCDETKPRCGRCAEANVSCEYTTRVTFLEKNIRSQLPVQLSSVTEPVPNHTGYAAIEFVNEGSDNRDTRRFDEQMSSDVVGEMVPSAYCDSQTHTKPSDIADISHRNAVSPAQQVSAKSAVTNFADMHTHELKDAAADQNMGLALSASLSENHVLLLQYYINNLSPWLDVYDLDRMFGVLLPQLAMHSPPILRAVLSLTVASQGSGAPEMTSSANYLAFNIPPSSYDILPSFGALQILVGVVFSMTKRFVGETPDSWDGVFSGGGRPPRFDQYEFASDSQRKIWQGAITLMCRLDIAYSLMHEVGPGRDSSVIKEILARSSSVYKDGDDTGIVMRASLQCLALLNDVLTLCLEPREPNTPEDVAAYGKTRVDRWKALVTDLSDWHSRRPLSVKPLTVFEGSPTSFPTVLFTSAAGVVVNMLYHTAMLLLTSHKHRSTGSIGLRDQETGLIIPMSPLWHSRRICGIASTTDGRCWDPCMIAAFFMAARRMTHPDQQKQLLLCISRVRVAGWRVDSLIQKLHNEWG
ncbi:hypothetical protein G7046_g848 [Stylonectria norvegica]|nr:hypothetical protein G7046_g848 [Stylonectria norvegica]